MKLNRILELTGEKYGLAQLSHGSDAEIAGLALLDGSSAAYKPDILYIGYAGQLSGESCPQNCIVCREDPLPENIRQSAKNLFTVEGPRLFSLYNELASLIGDAGGRDFYSELKAVADREKSIEAVINAAASQLGNPLLLIDSEFKITGYSTGVPVTDRLWAKNAAQGYCSYRFIQEVAKLLAQQQASLTVHPTEMSCTESPYRKYYSNIFLRSVLFGYLLLIEEKTPVTPRHLEMMETVSRVISYTISLYMPYLFQSSSRYERVIYDLVIGASSDNITQEMAGLSFPAEMRVLFIQPQNYLGQKYIKEQLTWAVSTNLSGAHLAYHSDGIVCLIPDCDGESSISESLKPLLETEPVRVGVSNSFSNIDKLSRYYNQARRALQLGEQFGGKQALCLYLDYQLHDLLSASGASVSLGQYCHPALHRIRKYDHDNGTALYDTLQSYLDCGCSIKECATRLFLHRNTVVYRLEKIHELWHIDTDDPQIRLLLQISFLIDRLLGYNDPPDC
jgi:hypothetical protein